MQSCPAVPVVRPQGFANRVNPCGLRGSRGRYGVENMGPATASLTQNLTGSVTGGRVILRGDYGAADHGQEKTMPRPLHRLRRMLLIVVIVLAALWAAVWGICYRR